MPAPTSRRQSFRKPLLYLSLLLLAGVGMAMVLGVRSLDSNNAWVEHTFEVINTIEKVEATMRGAESAARGYRLSGNDALKQEYLSTVPAAIRALNALVESVGDNPTQQQHALQAQALATARFGELQQLIDIQDAQGKEAAQAAMRIETSIERMRRLSALTDAMHAEELRLLEQRRASSARSVQLLLAFVVLGIGLALVLLWIMIRSLASENRRGRELEREARESIVRLEEARALSERLSEQRRALSVYAGLLQSCHNLDEAMELTASTLKQLVPHAGGRCYVGRASGNFFETAADFGREAIASSDLLRNEDCWALRRGQPHHTDGSEGRMRCAHLDAGTSLAGISTLCVPLIAQGASLGLLHVNAPSDGGPGDNDAQLIESVAEQLAMAMANLQLRETLRMQSLRDPLTGLFNRRYLEENLQRELLRCERRGLPLSLLMLDVDHFKQFNDQHGHAAGDAVLAHVGRTLQSMVRNEDLACRYGGEEFTVVLPETDADVAIQRAEAMRAAISASTLLHLRKTLGPVTVSIGVASFPVDGATPEVLLELADASLYRAKAEGRDRVVHAAATA
ncbi:MAG: diguanylate cyclase [Luteimonas sp.]